MINSVVEKPMFDEDTYHVVDPESLVVRPPFSELFPIAGPIRKAVEASMREDGFDKSKPINVWRAENVVVDGHTRRLAAIAAGVDARICYHDFKDEDEALEYAIANQRDRRNLTDADILRCVKVLDRRRLAGRPSKEFVPSGTNSPRSSENTAAVIGTNYRKVERARTILDHADEETKEAVEKGEATISMAYNQTMVKRRGAGRKRKKAGRVDPHPAVVNASSDPAERRGEPEEREITPEDRAWLDSLSLRRRVVANRLDDDALVLRHLRADFDRLREELDRVVGVRSESKMGLLHRAVHHVVNVSPVDTWVVCPKCKGSGVNDGPCRSCRGGGYRIPGF